MNQALYYHGAIFWEASTNRYEVFFPTRVEKHLVEVGLSKTEALQIAPWLLIAAKVLHQR